jgi:hypothetical protein
MSDDREKRAAFIGHGGWHALRIPKGVFETEMASGEVSDAPRWCISAERTRRKTDDKL